MKPLTWAIDLVGKTPSNGWIVSGWYTPDEKYFRLAKAFAAQLDALGIPFHLYVVPKIKGEDWLSVIRRAKPSIVRLTMRDYPSTAVVLMDIDCTVLGPINPLVDATRDADVGISLHSVIKRHRGRSALVLTSNRVTVFRPTLATQKLLAEWRTLCEEARPRESEEGMFAISINMAASGDAPLRVAINSSLYSGIEFDRAPATAVIVHRSAHARDLPAWKRAEQMVRAAYRSIVPRQRLAERLGVRTEL